jgi:predicted phage-related endonuclease
MIAADRFIASNALDEQAWLDARRLGLSATTMSKAMTPSGFREVVDNWDNETPVPVNAYMQFGLDSEAWLSLWTKDQTGVMPNDWLIRHESDWRAIATPDGISLDHQTISEIKTTGKDWGVAAKAPINYQRQVQWQLYVTGASSCVFVWLLREENDGVMVPAWLEPKYGVIERDEDTITKMVEASQLLAQALESRG